MAFPEVDADAVYLCTGDPMPRDIEEVVRLLFNSGFNDAFQSEWMGRGLGGHGGMRRRGAGHRGSEVALRLRLQRRVPE